MAEIKLNCPKCGQLIACDELWIGHDIQCPTCKTEMNVPATAAPERTAPSAPGGSLVPQVPTSAAPKLSIGGARHAPASTPPQASQSVIMARQSAHKKAAEKKSGAIKLVVGLVVFAAAAAGGFYGYGIFKEKKAAKEAEKAKVDAAAQAVAAQAAAQTAAETAVIPPQWTLDVSQAKIPAAKVNGMIGGTNFVSETARLDPVGGALVLRFLQGALTAPDREIAVYLHAKPGEPLAGQTITVSQDMKGPNVPQITKRWKVDPRYAPTRQPFSSGYAMQLELGQIADGALSGKIFIALPDAEHSVVGGNFKATTSYTDKAPATATAAPPPRPAATPAAAAPVEQKYGIQ